MIGKRFMLVGLSLILALGTLLSACVAPAPVEPVKINLLTTGTRSAGYIFGFALSEIVNKYLPGVKLTALESKSYEINLHTYIEEPETRKNHFYLADSIPWSRARDGRDPFTTPATGLKCIMCYIPAGGGGFISYDPNITRPENLKGKTIAVNVAGVLDWVPRGLLNLWGIFDEVRYEKVGYMKSKQAVLDGTADVCFFPVATLYNPEEWSLGAGAVELFSQKKPIYWVKIPKEDIERLAAESGDVMIARLLPKGALPGPSPQEDVWEVGWFNAIFADENMDEELIYNIVKTTIQHVEEFKDYGPQYEWLRTYMAAPTLPGGEADWHPGALRAYKEAGMKIGERTLD